MIMAVRSRLPPAPLTSPNSLLVASVERLVTAMWPTARSVNPRGALAGFEDAILEQLSGQLASVLHKDAAHRSCPPMLPTDAAHRIVKLSLPSDQI